MPWSSLITFLGCREQAKMESGGGKKFFLGEIWWCRWGLKVILHLV